jgi:hypothetical protein
MSEFYLHCEQEFLSQLQRVTAAIPRGDLGLLGDLLRECG